MKTPSPDLAGRLLDVTEQVLRTDPPPRLQDVAELVGVSRATLYYYFSGRDDLLAFLLTAHAEAGARAVEEAADPHADPERRLRAAVTAMTEYLGQRPGVCAGLLGSFGEAGRMREVLRVNDSRILSPLRALLEEGRDRRVFAVDDAADAANAVVGGVLLGVLGRTMSGADPADPRFRDRLADQVTRGVLA